MLFSYFYYQDWVQSVFQMDIFFFSKFTEKNKELGAARSEIKALKATEAQKDKALEEVTA